MDNQIYTGKDLMPKINLKKIFSIGRAVLEIAIVLASIYFFGYKNLTNYYYQKGLMAGRLEINQLAIQQLTTYGQLIVNIPDQQGNMRTITLVPIQNATTSK